MVVSGNYAYIADEDTGLCIVNISNPAKPTKVSSYETPGMTRGVAISGPYAYIAARGLRVINVSDPAHPTEISSYNTPGREENVVLSGSYAYVAAGGSGLRIVDISNPAHLNEVGFYDTPGWATAVSLSGSYAYVADFGEGLRIIEISDPTNPREVGSYPTPGYARDVAVSGSYAYVAAMRGGLCIVNVSEPANPTGVGCYYAQERVSDVAVMGSYAYVTVGSGLRIMDISDPAHPIEIGSCNMPTAGAGEGITLVGSYVLIADGFSGLSIVDISNLTNPTGARLYDTPGYANDVAVSGAYVYVADVKGGLIILRLLRDKVTGSVPPTGGTFSSTSGDTQFLFPAGAFTQTVTLVYRHLWTDQDTGPLVGIGHTFEVTAVYSDTGQPAQLAPGQTYTVTVRYADAEKGPAIENTLALYYWDGSQWVRESSSEVDMAANTVIAHPNHFSLWAVLGETKRVYLPLVLRNYR